jgi:putative transposase
MLPQTTFGHLEPIDSGMRTMEQTKFRGKYRIASARLPGWDYATAAAYFVTGCTRDRHPFFGHVANRVIHRSALGQMAWDIWDLTPSQLPHCTLDAFVVMRWYKGRCTHDRHALRPDFGWQPRFYDRIIRNEQELQAVRHYIETNPAR